MRTFFWLFFVWCITAPAFAQLGGNATYQFLNLISSPRQAALGGKIITNVDYDVTQGLYNPATINLEMDNQLALNYANYLADISYGTAAYAYTIDRRVQTFHALVSPMLIMEVLMAMMKMETAQAPLKEMKQPCPLAMPFKSVFLIFMLVSILS